MVRAYFEAIDAHDMDRAVALWRPGAIDDLHGIAELKAPEEIKAWFESAFEAVPDLRLQIGSVTAEGERAAVHWRMSGTFNGTGKLMGLTPNGSRLAIEGIDLLTVQDGLIVSNLAHTNGIDMARQFGVLPAAGTFLERAMFAPFNALARPLRLIRRRSAG